MEISLNGLPMKTAKVLTIVGALVCMPVALFATYYLHRPFEAFAFAIGGMSFTITGWALASFIALKTFKSAIENTKVAIENTKSAIENTKGVAAKLIEQRNAAAVSVAMQAAQRRFAQDPAARGRAYAWRDRRSGEVRTRNSDGGTSAWNETDAHRLRTQLCDLLAGPYEARGASPLGQRSAEI